MGRKERVMARWIKLCPFRIRREVRLSGFEDEFMSCLGASCPCFERLDDGELRCNRDSRSFFMGRCERGKDD